MERIPDELISHILSYLSITDVVRLQQVSKRFLGLGRDSTLWKGICFDETRNERDRSAEAARQQASQSYNGTLQDLRHALTNPSEAQAAAYSHLLQDSQRTTSRTLALANWDPSYPREQIDYYEEFVSRHAKISVDWLALSGSRSKEPLARESTGTALLVADSQDRYAVSSLDDGSVIIHDLNSSSSISSIAGQSGPGLLHPGSHGDGARRTLITASGTSECVSIDASNDRAFFAVSGIVHEVDLNSLSLVSSKAYPFTVTAISAYSKGKPLMVGTHRTIHIHDPREAHPVSPVPFRDQSIEILPCPTPTLDSHVNLYEPGPLSILHPPDTSDSVWVAGRFTSLLQYSMRYFPRLLSTTHSGARISCFRALPYPYEPSSQYTTSDPWSAYTDRLRSRSKLGWTAICAGEYKGKGSLELFGISGTLGSYTGRCYLNRQTAGRSKLLSVATHGGMIVHSDGNGNLKWVERNGSSFVRSFNITDDLPATTSTHSDTRIDEPALDSSTPRGLFQTDEHSQGDIVQKIMPFTKPSPLTGHDAQKLLLWTGEGRLGVLGFGQSDADLAQEWHDAVETQVENTAERAKRDAERQFSQAMRRALERNADEVRFVKGLGLAGLV